MWTIDTRWFDVAVVMSIFGVGNVLFGRFEQHKPRGRRLAKVVLFLAVTLLLAETAGRAVAYGVLALPLVAAAYIHLRWLPAHGINGWTAEPYDRYLALLAERSRRKD
jgi:hypothetical protein